MTETMLEALAAAEVDPAAVVVSGPPAPDAPAPPEGPWVIVPIGRDYRLGGMEQGQFREYAGSDDPRYIAGLVRMLLTDRPSAQGIDGDPQALVGYGMRTAAGIAERTRAAGGAAHPVAVDDNDLLDRVGAETGHRLFALGTPFPMRSQPPSDVGREYHRYRVLRPLEHGQEGLAAPWFNQPGGGSMVVLDKPIRWFLDRGYLVELEPGVTSA